MLKSEDAPAPASKRGFFAGLSSLGSLSSSAPCRAGRPMVIFLGPRLGFGSERDVDGEFEGGGREKVDFLDGGGRLLAMVDFGSEGACSLSLSLSLP